MNRKQSRAERKRSRGPSPDLLAQAIRHHREGRLKQAEEIHHRILARAPRHGESLHLLALIFHETGRHGLAAEMSRRAVAALGGAPSGLLGQAQNVLAQALWAEGKTAEAEAAFRHLLTLDSTFDGVHADLGSLLWEQGRLDEALGCYRNALALSANDAGAHAGLGNVLRDRGELHEAISSYRRALALRPDLAEIHNNLGNALRDSGKLEDAAACYRQALALRPDFPQVHNNLAVTLWHLGRLDEARAILERVAGDHPTYATALNNLAALLAMQDDVVAATTVVRRSLRAGETQKARSLFVDIVRGGRWTEDNEVVRSLMTRALVEAWGRPEHLAQVSADLLKLDAHIGPCIARAAAAWPDLPSAPDLYGQDGSAPLAGNPLLCALLLNAQNVDLALEHFLTAARRLLLEAAIADGAHDEAPAFHAALAAQCFVNDYVFSQSEEETRQADALCGLLTAALAAGEAVPALRVVALAAYRPLGSLPQAGRLLEHPWPQAVATLLAQQISEPQAEIRLRAEIPRLTPISDGVSRAVREQYEENPYPRWVRTAPGEGLNSLGAFLHGRFPLAPFQRQSGTGRDILIAGCGTGQQSIEAAGRFPGARILAVDLSLSSLAYARRKSLEQGLDGIAYAQADILELGGLDRDFDLIEAAGVLHHMADPFAGWGGLLSLLRPGGFMLVGLYSRMARRNILGAREFIAAGGYGTTPDQIRRCRQDLMAAGGDFSSVLRQPDFFGTSTCRDLLFHVQERYVSLAEIADYLRVQELAMLGFDISRSVIHAYRQRFPEDPAACDLERWQVFEKENPDTFSGMYQFWIQKPA